MEKEKERCPGLQPGVPWNEAMTRAALRAKAHATFWRLVKEHFFGDAPGDEAVEMDYDTFLRAGIQSRLLRKTRYNPKRHGAAWRDDAGLAPGDTFYVQTALGREE